MTKPAPATKAQFKRAIAAVRESGLHVVGVRPDGTVLVADSPSLAPAAPDAQDANASKWLDVEA